MTHTVDAVIIGGGPAGAACAISLQKQGVSNLILEQRSFPRRKTCGGLMTEKTCRLLTELLEEAAIPGVFCDRSQIVELHGKDGRLTRSQVERPLRSVRRITFDNALIERYRALGGTVLENQRRYKIATDKKRIVLENGDVIVYKHLVAADGALSRSRAVLGCKQPQLGFCLETYVPKRELPQIDAVQIHFSIVPRGYLWVFPSGEELCIGLGGVYQKGTDYRAILHSFLTARGLDPAAYQVFGAFVPIGKPVSQKNASESVMLIGDAGGFVDPMYGEGLYFALSTGLAAAEAIASGGGKTRFLRNAAPLTEMIRQGVRVQKVFFRAPALRLFERKIRNKNGFVRAYCDKQLSTYQYSYAELISLYRSYEKEKTER